MASIEFSGESWLIKPSREPVGPGPNLFDRACVRVSPAGLHLMIRRLGRTPHCAEVILDRPTGFGEYRWKIGSVSRDFHPSAVLGLFTWDDTQPGSHNCELDIEYSAWGEATRTTVQFVVQPSSPVQIIGARPEEIGKSELAIRWLPNSVSFEYIGENAHHRWVYRGDGVPIPGPATRVRMNLWLFRGDINELGREFAEDRIAEVVINSFSYLPAD